MLRSVDDFKIRKIRTLQTRIKEKCDISRVSRWSIVDNNRKLEPSHVEPAVVIPPRVQRLERLKKWQEEKRKRLEAEKKGKKPVWKCGIAPLPKDLQVSIKNTSAKPQTSVKIKTPKRKSIPKTRPQRKVVMKPTVVKPKTPPKVKKSKTPPKVKKMETPPKVKTPIRPLKRSPPKAFEFKLPSVVKYTVSKNVVPSTLSAPTIFGQSDSPVFNIPKVRGATAKIHQKLQANQLTPTQIVTRNSKKKQLDVSYQTFSTNSSDASTPTHPKRPIEGAFFEALLETEIERLNIKISEWNKVLSDELPTNIQDEILATIGQTRLLIAKKFEQFRGLTYGKNSEKEVQSGDLEGFWEMMHIQVDDLDKRFEKLEILKNRNWVEEIEIVKDVKKVVKKTRSRAGPSKDLKEAIKAARSAKLAQESPGVKIFVPKTASKKRRYTPFLQAVMQKATEEKENTPVGNKMVPRLDSPRRTSRFRQSNTPNKISRVSGTPRINGTPNTPNKTLRVNGTPRINGTTLMIETPPLNGTPRMQRRSQRKL